MKRLLFPVLLVLAAWLQSCGEDDSRVPAGWPCTSNTECVSGECIVEGGYGVCA